MISQLADFGGTLVSPWKPTYYKSENTGHDSGRAGPDDSKCFLQQQRHVLPNSGETNHSGNPYRFPGPTNFRMKGFILKIGQLAL